MSISSDDASAGSAWLATRLLRRPLVQLLLLSTVVVAAAYARSAIGPLQESIRTSLALSDNAIALLQGLAIALPVVVAAVPLGYVVDRYNRIRLVFVLVLLQVAGSVLTALASGFAMLFAARCLVGVSATATYTAALCLIGDLCPPGLRGRATMLIGISQMAGMSAAFAVGGALLGVAASDGTAWRWVMLWTSVPIGVVIASVFALREPARAGVTGGQISVLGGIVGLWRFRRITLPLLCGMIFAEMALNAVLVWAAPALARVFALSSERIGAVVATALMVSGLVGPVMGGLLADLCQRSGGSRRSMRGVAVLLVVSIPPSLFVFVPGALEASTLLIVFIVLISAACVMGTTIFTIAVPNEIRGFSLALLFATSTLFGVGLAPVVVSALSDVIGGPPMIGKSLAMVCAGTSLLGAFTFAAGSRFSPHLSRS